MCIRDRTYSLPARQVANGVVDSFIHVVEQYLTYPVNAKVQDAFSEGLMRVIHEEGLKVLDNPNDYDIRANLMWASTNALNVWIGQGVPQDWSSHRMGYALTAQFGLDHAQTLAILLPGVMTYMFKEKQVKLARMGEVVFGITDGTEEERARKAIVACEDFFCRMGLKTRLGECGIAEKDLDALAADVYKRQFFGKFFAVERFPLSPVICIRKSLDWRDYRFGAGTEEDVFDGEKGVSALYTDHSIRFPVQNGCPFDNRDLT